MVFQLDVWTWPEESYQLGPVLPFFLLSVRPPFFPTVFLKLAYFFLKLYMVLRACRGICVIKSAFFWKNPLWEKNDQKCSKIAPKCFFGLLRKIYSLVLSGNGVKWKGVCPFNILRKPHMWEKSPVRAKYALSQSDFSIF